MGGVAKPTANGTASAGRMDLLLNATFAELPRTWVLLASLIGSVSQYGGKRHAAYNAALPELAGLPSAFEETGTIHSL